MRWTIAALLVASGLLSAARAQGNRADEGLSREQMWPQPTAEDWERPVLVRFQRTWDDAVALARRTGRPILVCVNMDGEIASEHYAGIRYRQPEVARLYEPFVCVIASVYRHTPRDYDERGRRVICPRFGSVTCGEHIAIEPIVYEKFMDGVRVAPRHIVVDPNGAERLDVYYAFDTQSVFDAIREGAQGLDGSPAEALGDRPLTERVASPWVGDRERVERAFLEGDARLRRTLLEAAARRPEGVDPDLLRLALAGGDPQERRLAVDLLARTASAKAAPLIAQTLRTPLDAEVRDRLLAALERLARVSPEADLALKVHQGLEPGASPVLDADRLARIQAEYRPAHLLAPDRAQQALAEQSRLFEANDAEAAKELALALVQRALAGDLSEAERRAFWIDAERAARRALRLGADDGRLHAIVALAARGRGDLDTAFDEAEAAVRSLPDPPLDELSFRALDLFARARWTRIADALRARKPWPGVWLADFAAAAQAVASHPLAGPGEIVWVADRLRYVGAWERAREFLERGLERFPDDPGLHDRLRGLLLATVGPVGLEEHYAAWSARPDAPEVAGWFAGYATLVAAEFHRRARRVEEALAAYDRARRRFERWAEEHPEGAASCAHYAALALAGKARLFFERGDFEHAVAALEEAFALSPSSAAAFDGLNVRPADTARALLGRLEDEGRSDLRERLERAISKLPPEALEPPAYERAGRRPDRR